MVRVVRFVAWGIANGLPLHKIVSDDPGPIALIGEFKERESEASQRFQARQGIRKNCMNFRLFHQTTSVADLFPAREVFYGFFQAESGEFCG
jgi:hypothetical protein